jgi:3,4-dihydroxy 2-butanone 4-phosphate synthase/GTP cyclohydrolase II
VALRRPAHVEPTTVRFAAVDDALVDIAAGRMVVLVDDEDPESDGVLVMAAEFVTPNDVNFMTRQAGGWICVTLTPRRCDELGLGLMPATDQSARRLPFTVTIDARHGVTTGISTADQAHTIRLAVDASKGRTDLVVPGHVHPLRAHPGGVLERWHSTEASVDLARLAGATPAAVVCEIQNDDGSMARLGELAAYAARHELKLITIRDLLAYRLRHDRQIERVRATHLRTPSGELSVVCYRSLIDDTHHVALVTGDPARNSTRCQVTESEADRGLRQ